MKQIAVIFGGVSSEYGVSLQSAEAVLTHLDPKLYQIFPIGITQDGKWYLYSGDTDSIINDTWWKDKRYLKRAIISPDRETKGLIIFDDEIKFQRLDAVFPVLHGKNGEDGTVQGLIELAGLKLIGCGVLSSALCMDKNKAHQLAEKAGIKTAYSVVFKDAESAVVFMRKGIMKYPVYVKPLKAGSSYGITKAEAFGDIHQAIKLAFEYDNEVIIEEEVQGFEVGCAVLGKDNRLISGEIDEIEVNQGFFDFKEKYTLETSKIHLPARLPAAEKDRIRKTAEEIYSILGCSGFARVDMFYTPKKEIVFNEVNTIPGFTAHSRYPGMMKEVGINFKQLLDILIDEALS